MSDPGGSSAAAAVRDLDVAIVGAGFSGLYMLYRIRDGLGLETRVFETFIDFPDQILLYAIGLDDGKSTFSSHSLYNCLCQVSVNRESADAAITNLNLLLAFPAGNAGVTIR